MKYRTRKMVAARDLNSNGWLFGGRALAWIDEESFIYAACQLDTASVVTRGMSEVEFLASARQGDLVEIGTDLVRIGRTSITIRCELRNRRTRHIITRVEGVTFVHVDRDGQPVPHGCRNVRPLEDD